MITISVSLHQSSGEVVADDVEVSLDAKAPVSIFWKLLCDHVNYDLPLFWFVMFTSSRFREPIARHTSENSVNPATLEEICLTPLEEGDHVDLAVVVVESELATVQRTENEAYQDVLREADGETVHYFTASGVISHRRWIERCGAVLFERGFASNHILDDERTMAFADYDEARLHWKEIHDDLCVASREHAAAYEEIMRHAEYVCVVPECGKVFNHRDCLLRHLQAEHETDRRSLPACAFAAGKEFQESGLTRTDTHRKEEKVTGCW
eukprot:TRINITY_DN102788_c0_g1_i1.p1 TRINITY_DN102788_c0_g1~~TRINITY_DN102788_c0_g1_i1.p1  ORF type:complete len:267 (-),score=33.92 TRINITY_DN102788_c0_g1_i1:340-1140(-)